jgi:hypothetical protein
VPSRRRSALPLLPSGRVVPHPTPRNPLYPHLGTIDTLRLVHRSLTRLRGLGKGLGSREVSKPAQAHRATPSEHVFAIRTLLAGFFDQQSTPGRTVNSRLGWLQQNWRSRRWVERGAESWDRVGQPITRRDGEVASERVAQGNLVLPVSSQNFTEDRRFKSDSSFLCSWDVVWTSIRGKLQCLASESLDDSGISETCLETCFIDRTRLVQVLSGKSVHPAVRTGSQS